MIGTRLANRYEVIGELGRGGMGVVYRARDPLLNRDIAVKLIPPALLTPQLQERFQREAQLVAQMDHPAIVTIYDIGEHEGSLFFLMPVVQGRNLRQFIAERPRSLGELIDITIQTADALEYSHQRGIVHRDIKPENIMVSEEDDALRVRVMDFGLAKATAENRLTKTGTLVGTMAYLSPEQVVAKEVDARSDIYSLGTVLYECLAGEPPFTGEMQAILYRVVHEIPRSICSRGVHISEELDEIVLLALAKDPSRRYQRAADFAETLRRYQARLHQTEREQSIVLSTVMTAQMQRPPSSPFVGREKESAELQRRLNAAVDGECQFVVVAGEPGIGKTRLVEELEKLAKARKIRVLHGRFVEQERAFSFQAFLELIQEYFRSKDVGSSSAEHPDLSDLAPDLVALFPMLTEISDIRNAMVDSKLTTVTETLKADDRTYVYELLARTLTRIAAGKPLMLILENLHSAELSLDALRYIVRRLGPTPTLIAGTYRQTEIDKRHPLVRMLDGFSDDPRFLSIYLGPLSPSEHRQLIESLIGSANLSNGLAERIFEATEANPFFTKELVRSLVESGGIGKDASGTWSLSGEMAISSDALPATIQQAVEKRIERLPDEVREILSIASVLGKAFEFRDLELLAESKEVEEIVDRLVHEGIVEEERESRGDRLAFASGIVRDVLYNALSRRRRKSLHRKYAEQIEKRHSGRLERIYPQLLHHFSEGDVPEKTVDYGLKLAKKLLDAFSTEEAIHVLKTVLEFLEDESWGGDRSLQGEARLLLASAHRLASNNDAALREAEAAIRIFDDEKNAAFSVEALVLASETAWQGRRIDETRTFLERGIDAARAVGDVENLLKLLSLGGTVANLRGDHAKAKQYLDEAERMKAGTKEKAKEEEVPRGGRLVVALANPAPAHEPAEMGLDEEVEILSLVFETLVKTDEQGHLVPWLCEKWEMLDGGRSIMITLRKEVRFDDGTPLTAKAVKDSFERAIRIRTREIPAAFAAIPGVTTKTSGESIESIIVHDDQRLEIQLAEALPIYPALLTDPTTAIVRPTDGKGVVGSGPFRVMSRGEDSVILGADPRYWRGSVAPLETIEFRKLPSATAIASGLRAGELDLARDLTPQDFEETLRDPRFRHGLVEAPKKNTYFIIFNMSSRNVVNAEVRRALCGVFRIHDLVWRTLGRLAQPASSLIPPGIFGHDPGRRRATLTREQASDKLRAAIPDARLQLHAAVHPLLQDRYRSLLQALLDVWRELGVDVVNETPTMEAYLRSFQVNDEIDLMIGRWNADYDDPDNFTNGLFHSRTGVLSIYFASPETDALLEEARTESHPAAREILYRKFENVMIDSAVVLPLFHDIDYRIASPKVRKLHLRSSPPYVNYAEVGKVETAEAPAILTRASGGIIYVPIAEDISSLDPAYAGTVEKGEVIPNVFDTLMRTSEGARVVPWLASEYSAEEGGRRYRFKLRDDVRFHDGRRLTSRDVRYSWERFLTLPETPHSANRYFLAPIRGAKELIRREAEDLAGFHILSSREFTVELETPLSIFPALISHVATAIVQEGTDQVSGSWREHCIGTGPFRVVQFEPGRLLELERNPNYWRQGLPKSDGIVFRFGVTPEDIRNEFRAGRLTIACELFPSDVEAFRHDPELASGYRETPRLSTYFAAFQCKSGPLADVNLRRQIVQGIDVAGVVARTLGRLAIPAHGIIPPGLLGYVAAPLTAVSPESRKYDLELKTVVHPMFFGQYSALARELTNIFREKGIRLRVMNKTMAEYLDAHFRADADLAIGRWVADYPDADTFAHGMLHSQSGSIGALCGRPDIDRLIEEGRTQIDPSARHAIYRHLEELVAREALLLPLFYEQVYRFGRPELEGLTLNFSPPEVSYEHLRIRR